MSFQPMRPAYLAPWFLGFCISYLTPSARLVAAEQEGPVAERIPVAQYDLAGMAGNTRISVTLNRFGDHLSGQTRNPRSPYAYLTFDGRLANGHARLNVTSIHDSPDPLASGEAKPEGYWDIVIDTNAMSGTWHQKGSTRRVHLHQDKWYPAFPYNMYVVMHSRRGLAALKPTDQCDADPDNGKTVIDEIQLYHYGKLVQTLSGFQALGWCAPSAPWIQDVNFDGFADIIIDTDISSMRHHIIYWQYSKKAHAFERSDALDEIQNDANPPEFDNHKKSISVEWDSTGTPDQREITYKWIAGSLREYKTQDCDYFSDSDKRTCVTSYSKNISKRN